MKFVKGGVTKPLGFKANGISCGIKRSGKPDLSLIVSAVPAQAAAVFTKNSVKAAPLIVSKKHLQDGRAQAIVTNSGNANCFTGKFGLMYAEKTAALFGALLKIKPTDVLVQSTGIIGKPLPFKKIQNGARAIIKGLGSSPANGAKAATAILTTDLVKKEIAVRIKLGSKKVTIGGMAKGSGMIAPNMATMLAFITTDASINSKLLKESLREAADVTFNCITVDGCMSTNDTVAVLANGLAKNKMIKTKSKDYKTFSYALQAVCFYLAKEIVLDGEGATKFIKIHVTGAQNEKQARAVGLQVANSNLFKCAAFASDPNWGRIAGAVGSVGIPGVDDNKLKIKFSSFKKKNIDIDIDLNLGKTKATCYTCDLSYEYVKINGNYN